MMVKCVLWMAFLAVCAGDVSADIECLLTNGTSTTTKTVSCPSGVCVVELIGQTAVMRSGCGDNTTCPSNATVAGCMDGVCCCTENKCNDLNKQQMNALYHKYVTTDRTPNACFDHRTLWEARDTNHKWNWTSNSNTWTDKTEATVAMSTLKTQLCDANRRSTTPSDNSATTAKADRSTLIIVVVVCATIAFVTVVIAIVVCHNNCNHQRPVNNERRRQLTQQQLMVFENRSYFAYEQLQKCAVDEQVHGPLFVTRHDSYFFKWTLFVVPKHKHNNKLGFYLSLIDRQQNISVKYELFCGKEKEVNVPCVSEFKKDEDGLGYGTNSFLPSVESLKEQELVVDGIVTVGIKIIMNVSDFDPLKWIAAPSLTPDPGHIARQLFANLIAGDRRGSDFTIVVGIGAGKKELYVNKVALEGVPFFDTLFRDPNGTGDGWKEDREGTMAMPTFDVVVVKEALRFVYLKEIGDDLLTRFGVQLLDLANQWMLPDLKTAIEREMITKLMSDRLNYTLAADYFELADMYHQEVLGRVAICRLIEVWPQFVNSPKGRNMANHLKDKLMESAMSASSGVFA